MTELGTAASGYVAQLPDGGSLTLSWAALTDVGLHRSHNEDSYVVRYPVFAVADGMGGHSAGDFASARVVARLAELAGRDPIDPVEVDHALRRATDDIIPMSELSPRGIGMTVTGVVVATVADGVALVVFNVGDSRTYAWHDGALRRVTVDHSVVQNYLDAGLITAEQAEAHPDSNIITRAIGFEADPESETFVVPLEAGTRILVCSDGLTRELGDAELATILGASDSPQDTVAALLDSALGHEGRDNITAVILDVDAVEAGGGG